MPKDTYCVLDETERAIRSASYCIPVAARSRASGLAVYTGNYYERTMKIRLPHLLVILGFSVANINAQIARPEAGPFDAARMDMQVPPAQGVAIRAGRLFESKSGAMLRDQVIVIKGDRIATVGPADRVQIPQGWAISSV